MRECHVPNYLFSYLTDVRAAHFAECADAAQRSSLRVEEDVVVVRGDSPVLALVVFLWVIFLVVSEESVQLDALLEVLDGLHASDLL